MIRLNEHQLNAVNNMKNGCLLVGEPGSGKSRTSLTYYYTKVCGGELKINGVGRNTKMKHPRDLYVITTAKTRDEGGWQRELKLFDIPDTVNVTIDSWNKVKDYRKVHNAFFIFDEQRVSGYGRWAKSYLDLARKNQWILLSATPGDVWMDYMSVFIANGFYKNKSEFTKLHCVYSPFVSKYPKLEGYRNEGVLWKHRNDISISLPVDRHTKPVYVSCTFDYNKDLYKKVWRDRWDPYNNEPIQETGKLMYLLRKVVNLNDSRLDKVREILKSHKRAIVFYNYTYELDELRRVCSREVDVVGEWNGEVHTPVPDSETWAYLVQYAAGSEGWNCITCNCIVFYSLNYSYKMMHQAEGRINRLNTPYTDLYYYRFKSPSPIDLEIGRALSKKRRFNEWKFLNGKLQ